jgi:hypothetical protein
MQRRSFLKNSIGALLFATLSSNKVLGSVIKSTSNDSLNVLLYLIQCKNGDWQVKGTKWTNITKSTLSQFEYNLDTFKPLEIVDYTLAGDIKEKYWKQYNCKGRLQKVNHLASYKSGLKAKESGQYYDALKKSYGATHKIHPKWWVEHGKRLGQQNKENGHMEFLHKNWGKDLGKNWGKVGADKVVREKLGIHGATKEKRKEWASIGGKVGGKAKAAKYDMNVFSKLGQEANIKKHGKKLYAYNVKTFESIELDSIGRAEKYCDVASCTITKILRGLQPKTRTGWVFTEK